MDIDWTEDPEQAERRTTVEEGTQFRGALTSNCPIDVRGRIEGEVQAPSLTVSESGSVHGNAKVGSLESQGELSGDFEADRVILAGVVKDNTVIRARQMEVRLASSRGKMQVIFGECELEVGEEPRVDEQPDDSPDASAQPAEAVAEAAAGEAEADQPQATATGDASDVGDASQAEAAVDESDISDAATEGVQAGEAAMESSSESEPEARSGESEASLNGNGSRRKKRGKSKAAKEDDDAAAQLTSWSSPPPSGSNSHSDPPPAE